MECRDKTPILYELLYINYYDVFIMTLLMLWQLILVTMTKYFIYEDCIILYLFIFKKCLGGKMSKECLTVLVLASITGEKNKLIVIRKSRKPPCFKKYQIY